MTSPQPAIFAATASLPPDGGGAGSLPAPARTLTTARPAPANPSGDRPAIYVACLASYNSGILHGDWIWADDADDMRDATRAMLARSPEPDAEEWAIHDHAGFEGARIEEYQSFETVADIAGFIEELGELGAKVLEHFGQDLDDARKAFEDYCGEFESLADYAEELTTECGTNIPESLRHYIDYAAMGRDMEINGDVFTVQSGHAEIHIFRGH
ncbi:antirestriction protein ArdA [Algimonas porphyrae]|uniref:Antirestriction protein ArdA n=1 Tax=Algimonas porphyrae TaxID=1128113 RepID=A0ABQ5UYQ3_9PROT|nr:antirestriction protein ArdA [Algimonas porphyrae]GLQ19505.1 hypothetical protein GCM10007854_04600 [Algimonas porphyrae]